jgi:hypothetical protein
MARSSNMSRSSSGGVPRYTSCGKIVGASARSVAPTSASLAVELSQPSEMVNTSGTRSSEWQMGVCWPQPR